MKRCFNFELLERQKKRIRQRLFDGTYTPEQYYEVIHRRGRERENKSGWCANCEAYHDMPYQEAELQP